MARGAPAVGGGLPAAPPGLRARGGERSGQRSQLVRGDALCPDGRRQALPSGAGAPLVHRAGWGRSALRAAGLRGRVHPHLQPGARRPAVHGRRRPATRATELPRPLRRGHGRAVRRRLAGQRLRAARQGTRAAGERVVAYPGRGRRRAGHGRWAGARHAARSKLGRGRGRTRHAPREDRGPDRRGGGDGRGRRRGRAPRSAAGRSSSAAPWGPCSRSPTTSST